MQQVRLLRSEEGPSVRANGIESDITQIEQAGKSRVRYANISPGHVARLIEEHLINNRPVEEWEAELFDDTPASLTGTLGAIAATGSLILWPSREEPRLMSLVPPVHFALLKASEVYDNFFEVQQKQQWAAGMPTNALLVSGPSKPADIEQVLAYGAHGPKDLVVLILEDA